MRSPQTPESDASARELQALLEAAIDELPEAYRTVIMIREVQEMSTAETADCLEVSEEVVKVRLHRAKLMLREVMAERLAQNAKNAFSFLGARCDRVVQNVMDRLRRSGNCA
jgi:RNA polymerase sigma-70 factor (ECF subfamily)